jgi:hypothetical protein
MLPGFRFLFAAIILSTSILIFGLGAAALLRAAHEEVANIPARRPPPERVFAQANEPSPTLAMLRLEPPPAEEGPDANPAAAPAPAAKAAVPAEPEKLAAVGPEHSGPVEIAKAEEPTEEPTPAPSEASAPPETTATAEEAKSVNVVETPAPATEAAPAAPEPTAATVAPETSAATRIATPGDPAVTIEQSAPAKPANAKPDKSAVKKHTQTQRAKAHRHARLARQAIPQEPGDPFGLQPTITTRATR